MGERCAVSCKKCTPKITASLADVVKDEQAAAQQVRRRAAGCRPQRGPASNPPRPAPPCMPPATLRRAALSPPPTTYRPRLPTTRPSAQVIIPGQKAKVDPQMAQQVRDAEAAKREGVRKQAEAKTAAQRAQAQARARADQQMRAGNQQGAAQRDAAATLVASHMEVQAKGTGAVLGSIKGVAAPVVRAPQQAVGQQRMSYSQLQQAQAQAQGQQAQGQDPHPHAKPEIKSSSLTVKQLIIKCHHQPWLSVEQMKDCNRYAHARKEYSVAAPASPPPPAVKAPEVEEADGAARPDTTAIITSRQSEEDLLEEANERREILQEQVAPEVEYGQPKPPGQFMQLLQASFNMPALWIAAGGLGTYGVSRYVRRRRSRSGQRRE
jgi:hypothetical protein